ncbi:MAG: hypothetical protein H7Y86_10735 [Rhizobacter sp.]|nr:hypothetical protein [Ferruginibacter sp.]
MTTLNAKMITENAGDISMVSAAGSKNKFCDLWPNAKTGLELLQGIIKNPIVKVSIGVIIAAGDAVASRVC